MKKIIILIIANNDKEYYIEMQQIWKKYMNLHPNIKSYFIKYSNNITEDIVLDDNNNTIWIKGIETYIPGILDKTIKSYEYFIKSNIDFDYILRTNLSSVISLDRLYEFVSVNNEDYYGVVGKLTLEEHIKNIDVSRRFFPSGICILLSKNCIEKLIIENINYDIIDDVSIGMTLANMYNINNIEHQTIIYKTLFNKNKVNDKVFIYRCKNNSQHSKTLSIMQKTLSLLYKINY